MLFLLNNWKTLYTKCEYTKRKKKKIEENKIISSFHVLRQQKCGEANHKIYVKCFIVFYFCAYNMNKIFIMNEMTTVTLLYATRILMNIKEHLHTGDHETDKWTSKVTIIFFCHPSKTNKKWFTENNYRWNLNKNSTVLLWRIGFVNKLECHKKIRNSQDECSKKTHQSKLFTHLLCQHVVTIQLLIIFYA